MVALSYNTTNSMWGFVSPSKNLGVVVCIVMLGTHWPNQTLPYLEPLGIFTLDMVWSCLQGFTLVVWFSVDGQWYLQRYWANWEVIILPGILLLKGTSHSQRILGGPPKRQAPLTLQVPATPCDFCLLTCDLIVKPILCSDVPVELLWEPSRVSCWASKASS